MRGRSAIPFHESGSGRPVRALDEAEILVSSAGLGWAGLQVEVGRNAPWEVRDLAVAAHYLALNTDAAPLSFEAVVDGRRRGVTLNPGQMWFCPAGASFSHRVPTAAGFALVTLDPARLERALERTRPIELRKTYEVERPQLTHLVRALAAEAERGGPGGAIFADALATALAVQIAEAFGAPDPTPEARGGLSRAAVRRVLDLVEAGLGESITVEAMARAAGLSPAHFARAFKAALGTSPHQYVLKRRLEEARRALERPEADVLNVALRFGFADQAHLTRLFKRAYGVTPGRFARGRPG